MLAAILEVVVFPLVPVIMITLNLPDSSPRIPGTALKPAFPADWYRRF
jgi:hypothetical protein